MTSEPIVMAGLVPATQKRRVGSCKAPWVISALSMRLGGRDKPGHDENGDEAGEKKVIDSFAEKAG